MSLTTEEAARLLKLKSAYDKLLTGAMVNEVENAQGERMRFVQPTEADKQRIRAEIDKLEAKASGSTRRQRGAITFSL